MFCRALPTVITRASITVDITGDTFSARLAVAERCRQGSRSRTPSSPASSTSRGRIQGPALAVRLRGPPRPGRDARTISRELLSEQLYVVDNVAYNRRTSRRSVRWGGAVKRHRCSHSRVTATRRSATSSGRP